MLYICIFSNKFDLNQAIRVSHINKHNYIIIIKFIKWIGRNLCCWSKIPSGSPAISKILVIDFTRDFVASTHSDFFQGCLIGACTIGLTILGNSAVETK